MNNDNKKTTIHIGGNVSGQNINIGSTQTIHGDLTISVSSIPAASQDIRDLLKSQIAQLTGELEKQPENKTREVKEVKMAVEDAVDEAGKPQPDKERLQIRGDKLIEAAKNLAAVAPIAVQIAKTLLMIG